MGQPPAGENWIEKMEQTRPFKPVRSIRHNVHIGFVIASVVLAMECVAVPVVRAVDGPPVAVVPVATNTTLADCPEIVFIKRHHIRPPFGIGTVYAWNCYSPGGGIYAFDPRRPEQPHREIFRGDDGVVFNIELSYDARKILFSWMSMAKDAHDSFHIYEVDIDGQHPVSYTHLTLPTKRIV